ncbi:hypothetical protein Tco_0964186 [Tanacetum coccineum]
MMGVIPRGVWCGGGSGRFGGQVFVRGSERDHAGCMVIGVLMVDVGGRLSVASGTVWLVDTMEDLEILGVGFSERDLGVVILWAVLGVGGELAAGILFWFGVVASPLSGGADGVRCVDFIYDSKFGGGGVLGGQALVCSFYGRRLYGGYLVRTAAETIPSSGGGSGVASGDKLWGVSVWNCSLLIIIRVCLFWFGSARKVMGGAGSRVGNSPLAVCGSVGLPIPGSGLSTTYSCPCHVTGRYYRNLTRLLSGLSLYIDPFGACIPYYVAGISVGPLVKVAGWATGELSIGVFGG